MNLAWLDTMALVKEKKYEEAYQHVMAKADDMYFIRLLVTTTPKVLSRLQPNTTRTILEKINSIVRTGVFEMMAVDWIEAASQKEGLLNAQERATYMETLKAIMRSQVHYDNENVNRRAEKALSQMITYDD
jgi:hypothetical protein